MAKKKVVLIGASSRVRVFVEMLTTEFADKYEIAGLMDVDTGKMRGFCESLNLDVPLFTDFDAMCDVLSPDIALITTVDRYHAEYVIRSLDRKIGVVCEKPLCISAEQCRAIQAARERNPEVSAVTSHNQRYFPPFLKMKEMISSGVIGKVLTVQFMEMLDRYHGTSYFRRWNSEKANTGGLQFHKSSHHFDALNWLLDSRAAEVTAAGALLSYGEKASPFRGERCSSCSHDCPYRVRYHEQEGSLTHQLFFKYGIPGGYTPDLCIFRPEIDIEDAFSAAIRYENGVFCSYSLTAQANYEGMTIMIDGEKGRIEFESRIYRDLETQTDDVQDTNTVSRNRLTLCRYGSGFPEEVEVNQTAGGHGGADPQIIRDLFGDTPGIALATLEDGIQAVLIAAAVNRSMDSGRPARVQELLKA